jgi:hypothetical protein
MLTFRNLINIIICGKYVDLDAKKHNLATILMLIDKINELNMQTSLVYP